MAERRCIKIGLHGDDIPRARAWAAALASNPDAGLGPLHGDGVGVQTIFLERTGTGAFLLFCLEAESFTHAITMVKHAIRAVKAYPVTAVARPLDSATRLERLVDLNYRADA